VGSPFAFREFNQPPLLRGFLLRRFAAFRPAGLEVRNQNLALSPELGMRAADGDTWRQDQLGCQLAQDPNPLSTAFAAINRVVLKATHCRVPASVFTQSNLC